MTKALIDGDLICYRCAASAENDDEEISLIRASRTLQDIISATDSDEIALFLSGSRNFRYDLYPDYKANRREMKRPRHLQAVREFLVVKWGADVTDGYEADDAIGMESRLSGTIVVTLDKDLRQVPGSHYNFVTGEFFDVDVIEGWRNFYEQLVLGDRADNIPGYDGKMRPKWPKFLTETREQLRMADSPYDMFHIVKELYQLSEEEFLRNANLLYIWRTLNDTFKVPTKAETTLEEKQGAETKSESTPTKQAETTQFTEPGSTQQRTDGFPVRGR